MRTIVDLKPGQSVRMQTSDGREIIVKSVEAGSGKARIGIEAPKDLPVVRGELVG